MVLGSIGSCTCGAADANSNDQASGSSGGLHDADASSTGDAPAPIAIGCDEILTPRPLRRLSRTQLMNTLHDVVQAFAAGDGVLAELDSVVVTYPEDTLVRPAGDTRGGYRELDQDVHQQHIDALFRVGDALGRALTQPDRLAATAGACATDDNDGNDDNCVSNFIERAGAIVLRRPLRADERAFYLDVYDGDSANQGVDPAGIADVVTVMIASPQFFYMMEESDGLLDAYALANRLAYHFWQTMPDATLMEAAASGALLTADGYETQVERLVADPRARAALDAFVRQWLWLDDLPRMDMLVGTPVFDAFRDDFVPGPDLHRHMQDEVLDAFAYAFDHGDNLDAFLTSDRSFARTEDLASIYNVHPWTSGEPPRFGDVERQGLMARAAFLATGTANTRPIIKGVFLTKLMCQAIAPPPDNAAASTIALSHEMSTRQVVEALTEQEGSACIVCHKVMNARGFLTEGFDALGRIRAAQTLFDDMGNVLGEAAIDTHAVPTIEPGDAAELSSAPELAQALAASDKVDPCFARHYLRFALGRLEDVAADACVLESLTEALRAGSSLMDVWVSLAFTETFRTRVVQGDGT